MSGDTNGPAAVQRPTLVLLHGSGDSAGVWDGVIADLDGYECVALDLPGHGALAGAPGPARMSIADYAAWVGDELARRGLSGVAMMGHSLGSAIALRLAVDAPRTVARLGLVGAGARLRVLPSLLEAARAEAGDSGTVGPQLDALAVAPGHEALARAWASRRIPAAPGVLYRDLAACDGFDMMGDLAQVSQPALVLTGAEDRLTPPKYATYLAEHIPHSTLVLLPGAGHYVMIEAPGALARVVRGWA